MTAVRTRPTTGGLTAPRAASEPVRGPSGFSLLLGLTVALDLVGLVMVLSASSVEALAEYGSSWYYFERQVMWVVVGTAVMVLVMRIDYRRWRRLAGPLLAVTLLLLMAVLVVGVDVGGSSRWLGVGSFQFQPSEMAKLAFILYGADVLARRMDRSGEVRSVLVPLSIVFGMLAGLIFVQPDMGTTMILTAIVFGLLWASGLPGWTVAKMTAGAVAMAFVLGMVEPYRRERLLSFLHPWADRATSGYQVVQSLIGLGSGGLVGVGLGNSRAKWGFLPNAHTDFIFSIIGEELGLLGSVFVVLLFAAFAVIGLRTAKRAPDSFGILVAVGITVWITAQAVLNMGAVIGLLPVTGVPLPLVSYGGSSLVIVMAGIGVLLNIAAQERREARL